MSVDVKVLVVDDEPGIRFFLTETLERVGYEVHTADKGESALNILRDTVFDLIFLDLNLGGKTDGMRILEMVKWRWTNTAVIILTAHGTMDSALTAIREGVEGYLLKPVTPAEVRDAAVEALSRRKPVDSGSKSEAGAVAHILSSGELSLDLDQHRVHLAGEYVDLTSSEFRLLTFFMENRQRVLSPRELVRVVREFESVDEREAREIIKWYIHRLRKKLGGGDMYIENVRGVGYRFGSTD